MLAIGLAVDACVHITHSFLVTKGTRHDRALAALRHIGPSVFKGNVSTFLAVLPLSIAVSYILQVFFALFTILILSSLFFGIVVLPVVLSLVGPDPIDLDHREEMVQEAMKQQQQQQRERQQSDSSGDAEDKAAGKRAAV